MATNEDTKYERHIGKTLIGFPASTITKITPGIDYLMNGPVNGEAFGTITVRMADGKELIIPKDIFRIQSA